MRTRLTPDCGKRTASREDLPTATCELGRHPPIVQVASGFRRFHQRIQRSDLPGGIGHERAGRGLSVVKPTLPSLIVGQRLGGKEARWRNLARQDQDLRSRFHRPGAENPATHRQPVRHQVVTHVLGTFCHPCVRVGHPTIGDPGRIRTCDPLLRRQMLYPTELRDLGWLDAV